MEHYDYLIVGCGIAGITMAERLADGAGKNCLVIDRRDHIGGNCYDFHDTHGVLVHPYGPHYFRTNSDAVVSYLSRFTEWRPTEYRVLSCIDGKYYNFPINLTTFEQVIGRPSSEEEMQRTLEEWRVPIADPQNSEEVIISQVGWKLYEMFFKNYTLKQWQRHPRELEASVCGRIPVRTNRDDRYLSEKFQALPKDGYTAMFDRMLASPRITVQLNADFEKVRREVSYDKLIYTGMIDAYFDYRLGHLPYRSLRFEREHHAMHFFQPAMQVNYPNNEEYTRIIEIKHATGQQISGTTIVKEYPQDYGPGAEAFYPVPMKQSRELYEQYRTLAEAEKDVIFLGRLATYRYYNMDQVVASALTQSAKLIGTPDR
jgi:UDP-galactopyranose mutase